MAWRLFTWGDAVEILEPAALREAYRGMVEAALRVAASTKRAAKAKRGASGRSRAARRG